MLVLENQVSQLLQLCNDVMRSIHELLCCSLNLVKEQNAQMEGSYNSEQIKKNKQLQDETKKNAKIAVKAHSIYSSVKGTYLTITNLKELKPTMIEQVQITFEKYFDVLSSMKESVEHQRMLITQMSAV